MITSKKEKDGKGSGVRKRELDSENQDGKGGERKGNF